MATIQETGSDQIRSCRPAIGAPPYWCARARIQIFHSASSAADLYEPPALIADDVCYHCNRAIERVFSGTPHQLVEVLCPDCLARARTHGICPGCWGVCFVEVKTEPVT
jgi:hypothetical protein